MGNHKKLMRKRTSATGAANKTASENARRMKLKIVVTHGDIVHVQTPVVVAGQYKGVAPLRAVEALDEALDHWIARAGERGMIGGNLGELFFIPVLRKQIAADSILLAAMGEYGRFTYNDLCYLMMNVTYAVAALGHEKFTSVLIGSGGGSLAIGEALKGCLSGVCDALDHLKAASQVRINELEFVENDAMRHRQICEALEAFAPETFGGIQLVVSEKSLPASKRKHKRGARHDDDATEGAVFVNRITIERGEEGFQFSALTDSAVVPVRKIEVQPFFTDGIADRLKKSDDEQAQKKFGRLLHKYIFPEDFEQLIQNNKGLTLVVDKTTAALPWELACFGPDDPTRRIYFGRDLRLTRQFRSMLSASPGIAPPVNKSLKFLIIADPASDDPELRLEGARREGENVVALLEGFKQKLEASHGYRIEIVSRFGAEGCNPVEVLSLILDQTFDVIHFSGHGVFDAAAPDKSGWVFSRKCTLSAREIFRARQVPRLVFANACFSGVCHRGAEPTAEESNQKLAGLAEAFFQRGVQNYVGTGWAVEDEGAAKFANVFYDNAMRGEFLSEALGRARRAIFDYVATWGAYQFYGQSNARIAPRRVG